MRFLHHSAWITNIRGFQGSKVKATCSSLRPFYQNKRLLESYNYRLTHRVGFKHRCAVISFEILLDLWLCVLNQWHRLGSKWYQMLKFAPISNSRVIVGMHQSDLDLDFNAVCLHLMKRSKRFHILWWKIKKSACWECMKCCLVLFALVEICFLSIANLPLGFWDTKLQHTHSSVCLKFPSHFIYSIYVMLSCVPHLSISVFRSASQNNSCFFQWKAWKAWFTPKLKFCQHLL